MYGESGLANHAAACAYGFLLSMAPMLLLLTFLIFFTLGSSPGTITSLLGTIPFFGNILDEKWLSSVIFIFARPGIPGLISAISVIWAGRILALSIQRGLKIVFPETTKRSPFKNTLVTLAMEISVILFVLVVIISSRTVMRFYEFFDFNPKISFLHFFTSHSGGQVFSISLLGLASYCVYRSVPANAPRKFSAFQGAFFCSLAYSCTVLLLGFILNKARYNFIYGTFGNLIIILINVYFFFTFFFIGAQLAFVTDFFDAMLFSRLRLLKNKAFENKKSFKFLKDFLNKYRYSILMYRFFNPAKNNLKKYFRNYSKGEIIFSHDDSIDITEKIFYLLEGEVEIMISPFHGNECFFGILKADSFFGGAGHLASEDQSTAVKAISNVSVIVIPPVLFDIILKYDSSIDRSLVEHMSRKLEIKNIA